METQQLISLFYMKNFIIFSPYGILWSLPSTHCISSTASTRLPSTTLNNHSQNSTPLFCFPLNPHCCLSMIVPCYSRSSFRFTPDSLWISLLEFGFLPYSLINQVFVKGKSFFVFLPLLPSHTPLIPFSTSHTPFSSAHNRFGNFVVFLPSDTSCQHCWIFLNRSLLPCICPYLEPISWFLRLFFPYHLQAVSAVFHSTLFLEGTVLPWIRPADKHQKVLWVQNPFASDYYKYCYFLQRPLSYSSKVSDFPPSRSSTPPSGFSSKFCS